MIVAPSAYDSKLPDRTWCHFEKESCLSIAELAVLRQYQRNGIAGELLNSIVSDRDQEIILVRTNETAEVARHLYEKNGFIKFLDFNVKNRAIEDGNIKGVLTRKILYVYNLCDINEII